MLKCLASVAVTLALAACGNGFVHDEGLSGPYRLVAIDVMEQMSLCRDVGRSGDCAGDGLGGEEIIRRAAARFI